MKEQVFLSCKFYFIFKFITARIYSSTGPLKNKSLKDFSFNDTQPAKLIIKKFCSLHVIFQSLLVAVVKTQAKDTSQLWTAPPMLVTWSHISFWWLNFMALDCCNRYKSFRCFKDKPACSIAHSFKGPGTVKQAETNCSRRQITSSQHYKQENKTKQQIKKREFCLHYLLNISICACKKWKILSVNIREKLISNEF